MSHSQFVHLHVHTQYSLLDGACQLDALINTAKRHKMPALAITDHGGLFGAIDFYTMAMANGIKPIIGCEFYMAPESRFDKSSHGIEGAAFHIVLLAKNETGYKNIIRLASIGYLEGFYYRPRIDREVLRAYKEGLVCLSACMKGEVPRAIINNQPDEARRLCLEYKELFNDDFYLEVQDNGIPEQYDVNKALIKLSKELDIQLVATNDVHYVNSSDAKLQDILLAVQTGSLLTDPKRMRMSDETYYLRTPQEMANIFSEVPEALSNTVLIAERCEVDLGFKGYHLPDFPVPEGYNPQTYLRKLCDDGLRIRYGEYATDSVIQERLEYELGIIHTMGFDAYFLIVWDLCVYAKENGIWYNARGSAAGSIVAYSLFISLIDPIEHGLIFERFLNPGRVSMPDIDIDLCWRRRLRLVYPRKWLRISGSWYPGLLRIRIVKHMPQCTGVLPGLPHA